MKKILQIFSLLLLSFLTVIVLGILKPQQAKADIQDVAICTWKNASQLRCVKLSDNALAGKLQEQYSRLGIGVGVVEETLTKDNTADRQISDLRTAIDINANCEGLTSASCDDMFYDASVSDANQAVFYNYKISSGDFQNNRIVCKTYSVTDPNDSSKKVTLAGNLCQETDTSGNAKRTVIVGDVLNATTIVGNGIPSYCGIVNIVSGDKCEQAPEMGGPNAGKVIDTSKIDNIFLEAVKATQQIVAAQKASANCTNNALSFFICPLYDFMQDFLKGTVNILDGLLIVPAFSASGDTAGIAVAVNSMKLIANAAYALLFLFIILANFISIPALDNYTVKKLLPKLIFVVIITQFAFFICSAMVDIGNVLGKTIPAAIASAYQTGVGKQLGVDTATFIANSLNPFTDVKTALNNNASINSYFAAASPGYVAFSILIIIVALIVLLIAAFYLAFRYIGLVVLTIISPIAFAAWVLPNTEKFAKWWISNFLKLVLLYPLVMIVLVASAIAADALGSSGSILGLLVSFIAPLVALILIPKLLKVSGGLITSAGNAITQNKVSQGGKSMAKNAAKKSAQEGGLAQVKGGAMEKFGSVLPGKAGLGLEARGAQLKKAKASAEKDRISKLSLARQIQLAGEGNGAAKAAITEKMSDLSNKGTLTAQEYADLKRLRSNAGQDTSMFTAPVTVDADGKATVSGVYDNPIFRSASSGGAPTSPTSSGGGGGSTSTTAPTTSTASAPPAAPTGSGSGGGQPGTQSANPARTRTTGPSTSGWQQRQSGLITPPSSGNSGGNTTSNVPPLTGPNGQPFIPPAPSGPTSQVPPSTTPPPPPPGPAPGPPPDFP